MRVDVAIIGAGPAGSAAALFFAKAGCRVALIDPRLGVRDQACGEGIMPAGVAILKQLGVWSEINEARALRSIRYISPKGKHVSGDFDAPAFGVRRTVLMAAMDTVIGSNALITRVKSSARAVIRHVLPEKTLLIRHDEGALRAHVAVLATGINSRHLRAEHLARDSQHSGLKNNEPTGPLPKAARWGLRRHFRLKSNVMQTDCVEVFWRENCEAYVTPVSECVSGVAFLSRAPLATFEQLSLGMPGLFDRFDAPVSQVRGRGPFPFMPPDDPDAFKSSDVIPIGDAAGYDDPITGDGITLGLREAQLLAQTFDLHTLRERFDEQVERQMREAFFAERKKYREHHHHWVRRAMILSEHPRRVELVVRAMGLCPKIMTWLVRGANSAAPISVD